MGLSEADTRAKLIDPTLHSRGWTEELIKREETAGAITIVNNEARKAAKGRIDYTLRVRVSTTTQPIAVALIEAKPENKPPAAGLEQGKAYARSRQFNVPFVFSTNGHLFVEYDYFTGQTSKPRPLSEFPTPQELRTRYEQGKGFSLESPAAKPLLMRYPGGETSRRYYQDAAIRAALEKIAAGGNRVLLTLATGAGKTFIAVNLLRKIADAGQLRRALFICDRDELRTQALGAFQNVFGSDVAAVSTRQPEKNARILVATYQTLDVDTEDAEANFLRANYPVDYFSHIIIDECHRSAWGKWSEVLKRNPNAVQIGLTATPRRLVESVTDDTPEVQADQQITADNYKHFGEPVYEYDIAQGIEDGYLAACEIQRGRVNLDDTGITIAEIMALNPIDADTGEPLTEEEIREIYQHPDYEASILLPDRVLAMAADLFNYLLQTGGPHQKTIIYCVRDRHADDVAIAMNNLYAQWCRQNGVRPTEPYAFKCTAKSKGNDQLADLRGSSQTHFIATTVDLLTTGVDVPAVQNIVFFKYVNSPISFYQMVGRGTRINTPTNKLMFRVYDYTNASRLFGEEFITSMRGEPGEETEPGPELPRFRTVQVEGFDVHITDTGRYILATVDGRAMPIPVEEYKQMIAARLVQEADTLERFRTIWINPQDRQGLLQRLTSQGLSVRAVQVLESMEEYDTYDILAELGYGMNPRTRAERAQAFSYKHYSWLNGLPPEAAATIRALAAQFARAGTDALETPEIFQTPEVIQAGGLKTLKLLGKPADVLRETKERMFAA